MKSRSPSQVWRQPSFLCARPRSACPACLVPSLQLRDVKARLDPVSLTGPAVGHALFADSHRRAGDRSPGGRGHAHAHRLVAAAADRAASQCAPAGISPVEVVAGLHADRDERALGVAGACGNAPQQLHRRFAHRRRAAVRRGDRDAARSRAPRAAPHAGTRAGVRGRRVVSRPRHPLHRPARGGAPPSSWRSVTPSGPSSSIAS